MDRRGRGWAWLAIMSRHLDRAAKSSLPTRRLSCRTPAYVAPQFLVDDLARSTSNASRTA
jgi:hypothetical protein